MRKSLGKLIRASSQMYEILWGNRLRITKDDNLFAFEPLGDRIQINSPFLITGLNNIIYNDLGATPMLKRSKTGTQLVDDKSTSCVPVSFPIDGSISGTPVIHDDASTILGDTHTSQILPFEWSIFTTQIYTPTLKNAVESLIWVT